MQQQWLDILYSYIELDKVPSGARIPPKSATASF